MWSNEHIMTMAVFSLKTTGGLNNVFFPLKFQLLELPKFMDNIIKIKTISSTYMAASGLSPLKQANVSLDGKEEET